MRAKPRNDRWKIALEARHVRREDALQEMLCLPRGGERRDAVALDVRRRGVEILLTHGLALPKSHAVAS